MKIHKDFGLPIAETKLQSLSGICLDKYNTAFTLCSLNLIATLEPFLLGIVLSVFHVFAP